MSIIEVGPQTFIATSGWNMACDFQHQKARELAADLGTNDIRVIGEALLSRGVSVTHSGTAGFGVASVPDMAIPSLPARPAAG